VRGRAHSAGGVKFMHKGNLVEVEGGEWLATDEYGKRVVINKQNTSNFRDVLRSMRGQSFSGKRAILSNINSWGGNGVRFAFGGVLPSSQPLAAPRLQTQQSGSISDLANSFLAFAQLSEARMNELANFTDAVRQQQLNLRVINDPAQTVQRGNSLIAQVENQGL